MTAIVVGVFLAVYFVGLWTVLLLWPDKSEDERIMLAGIWPFLLLMAVLFWPLTLQWWRTKRKKTTT